MRELKKIRYIEGKVSEMCKGGIAQVNGAGLNYEIQGEGEVVVLIHSGFTDLRLWDEQFDFFSKYFKVIRYDIRGFGKSDTPKGSFSSFQDLRGLLSYLEIEKVNLIGVSMGGSIAIDFTLEYPELVDSIILSGSSLNGYEITPDEASEKRSITGISIAKRDEKFNEAIDFMLNDPMWKQSKEEAHKHLKKMFMDTSLEWALEDWVIPVMPYASERLGEMKKRALIIVGSEDSIPILEIADVLNQQIISSEKVMIMGTGHLPNLDKPNEFNKIVLKFLLSIHQKKL